MALPYQGNALTYGANGPQKSFLENKKKKNKRK